MTTPPRQIVIAVATAPSDSARQLAEQLVSERLVACVNLVPSIQSIYRWQGAVESAEETLMILKTTTESRAQLEERFSALHPYEVPELLYVDAAGLPSYLEWVQASVA